MTPPPKVQPVSDYAIVVNSNDNVAVVKQETAAGLELLLSEGRKVCLNVAVLAGHRIATREIPAGKFGRQYGQPIGTSLGVRAGDWLTHQNMSDDLPVVRELPRNLHTAPPHYFPKEKRAHLVPQSEMRLRR